MSIRLLAALILFGFKLSAQVNLLANPGFETYTSCPTGPGQWQVCSTWNNVNMNPGAGSWGTPDYFNTCGSGSTAPPATFAGTCLTHGGNGMMALVVYNVPYPQYREYMASPLTCSMFPGNTYTVSFWVSNGTGIKSPWTIKNIGINFSAGPLTQTGWALITATPQLEVTSNIATTSWAQYSFTINPTSIWNYMTVGAFRADSSNNATMTYSNPGGANSVYSNYFFDDFAVLAPSTTGSVTLSAQVTQPSVCNGTAAVAIVPSSSVSLTYTWAPVPFNGSYLSPISPGVYTVTAGYLTNSCVNATTAVQFTVNATPPVQLTLTASSPTICGTNNLTLTANATGGTAPINYNWVSGPNSPINVVNQLTPGTYIYSVTVTDLVGCSATRTIAVNHLTRPAVVATQSAICTGGTATLTASGASTYTWLPQNVTGPQLVFSPSSSVGYTVVGTSATGCTNSISGTQIVFITPTITASSSKTLACPGESIVLTASGATSYTWDAGIFSSSYTTTASAPLTHTLIGQSVICFDTALISITLKPIPTLAFSSTSINCASLGSATAIISGGTGPFTHTWNPTFQTGLTATGLFPGNYTFTVFDQGTQCQITPTIYFAPLVPLTGTVVSTPSLVCPAATNGSAAIILSGGSGTQTYAWKDLNGIQTIANPTTLAAGINTIQVTDLLTFCTVTHTFFINGPPAFTLQLSSSSSSICLGDSILTNAFITGGTPGYTYTWVNHSTSNSFYAKENSAGTFSYIAQTTDAQNCIFQDTILLKFVPNPTVTVSSFSVCPLVSTTLTALGASSYSWSTGTLTNTLVLVPTLTNQYTVTGSQLGCKANATSTLFVFASPVPTIISNSPVCQKDSLWFSGTGGSTFQWTGPNNFSSANSTTLITLATPSASGVYFLKVTSIEGCTAQIAQSLTVHPTPLLIAGGSTVCEGSQLIFNANFLPNATYTWTGPGFNSAFQNPVITGATLSHTGTYSVIIQSVLGCTAQTSVQGSVVTKPVITLSGDSAICEKKSLLLNATGGDSYSWHGPPSYYSATSTLSVPVASPLHAGVYSIDVSYGPCTSQRTVNIIVHALPPISVAPIFTVCEKSTLQLNQNSQTAVSFTWQGPGGYLSNQQSPVISPVLISAAGPYTISVTDVDGCINSAFSQVTILPAPPLSVKDVSICLGGAVTLTASGGTTYQWSGPAGFTATGGTVMLSIVNFSNSGAYLVSTSGTNNCSITLPLQVTTYTALLPSPTINGNNTFCKGNDLLLSAGGGVSYEWIGPGGDNYFTDTLHIKNAPFNAAGIYTLTVKDASFCAVSRLVGVTIYPLPTGNVVTNKNYLCVPYCATFSPVSFNGNAIVSFNYKIGEKVVKDSVMSFCFNNPGHFPVSLSFIDTNQCVNTSTLLIHAFEKPVANFNFYPNSPRAGIEKVSFTNLSSGFHNASWQWYFQQNDSVNSQEEHPDYMFLEPGQHVMVLVMKNQEGCSDTMIKTIIVEDEFIFYVPDAFTPDGDGLNDTFIPKGQGIKTYRFEIFDRWGQEVFFTRDFTTGWDGTFKGTRCKTDSYVWRINLSDASGKNREYNGHVSLLR